MVTLETLEKFPFVLNEYAPLAQAVQPAAIPSIRHGATSGGTLYLDTRCIYYKKCSKHSNRNRTITRRNI
jgi:CO/xanthine dehydrogenase FAD-binding subunit